MFLGEVFLLPGACPAPSEAREAVGFPCTWWISCAAGWGLTDPRPSAGPGALTPVERDGW